MSRLGVTFLAWRRHCQKGLARHGITLKHVFILRQLSRRDYLYPADIAEMLFCDRPTATVVVDTMEKRGWVRRGKDPDNAKRMRVMLTESGRDKLASLATRAGGPRFDPLSCFSEPEKAQFEALLMKLHRHIKGNVG
jgi:DNA-binding MarR family transcriptional regulator